MNNKFKKAAKKTFSKLTDAAGICLGLSALCARCISDTTFMVAKYLAPKYVRRENDCFEIGLKK